uniref:BIR-domain-containing protein n=1 Tax=Kalmanozyma brasiliensis (strain GHG001) TaxID=1365824 RepID=V5EZ06_KALBG
MFSAEERLASFSVASSSTSTKEMISARKETFGSQWPYDGKKGWKPTSKKLAEAGFYFAPTDEEPDNAKCVYCSKSLGGWEKADDPVHEHQRRVPDCAFFNCELREPAPEPIVEEDAAEEEVEPVEVPKKGGKRAVSTTRKASVKIAKGKKSVAALAKKQEGEELDEAPAGPQDEPRATETTPKEPGAESAEVEAPAKKGGRKARSVSTKKLAAKAQVEEDEPKEDEPAEVAAPETPVEEPVQTLSKKKSVTGLGNGTAPQAAPARPGRAASRRATKAINLLSDEGLNRKLRRPDEEDLAKRELALSDPVVPFPTAHSEDSPMPATDPVQPTKPKKSRSRSKKLDQEAAVAAPKEPTPEPEVETPMEEDSVQVIEDNTVIEHDDDEAEEEPAEEPKRRGGRAAKATATKIPATKASASTTKSRKASAKATDNDEADATVADTVAFPSMSSEADPEPAQKRSSGTASKAVASAKNTSREAAPSSGSGKSSASSSSKRGPTKSSPLISEVEIEPASADSIDIVPETDLDTDAALPNTGSQATIRGAPRWSSIAAMAPSTGRSPLSHLPQLSKLDLDDSQRAMTLGEWLQAKAEAAAIEMRAEGEAQLADLENQFRTGRVTMERRLRGRA